jgi:outer membrane protein assembly factor BamB
MRKITALIVLLSLLALAGCQSTTSAPAATPRPTIPPTPTPAPVQVSLFAVSNGITVVALNPADGSQRWQHPLGTSEYAINTFLAVQDAVFIERGQTLTVLNASDGKERWHSSDFGHIFQVADGILLTQVGSSLIGLSMVDGKQLWSFPLGQSAVGANIIGDVVYATPGDGLPDTSLYALGLHDGKERWRFQQSGIIDVQAATQEIAYVTVEAPDGSSDILYALNQSNGQERWHMASPNADFFLGPTQVNGVVYVALDGHNNNGCGASPRTYQPGTLYALSAGGGEPLWHSQPSQAGVVYVQPAIDQSVLYSADEQSGYAFNTANGQQLWSSQILQSSDTSFTGIAQPIISGSLVYLSVGFCSLAQTVPVSFWALNKSDGHVVWRYQGSQRNDDQAGPLVLNGMVYITTAAGGVEALNGSDGTQLWQNTTFLTNLTSNVD